MLLFCYRRVDWRQFFMTADFTGVPVVTIECNNPQSVSEMTDLIFWPAKIKITGHRC